QLHNAQASATTRRSERNGYDQKLDQRVAKHEFLRDRNNVTSCRSLARRHDAEWRRAELQQKRQTEFWKRRQIEPTVVPSAIEEDVQNPPKVILREKTRKADPLDRRSLVMAEDLGITWPDVTSIEKQSEVVSMWCVNLHLPAAKEALWREENLKQKLVILQKSTSTLTMSSDKLWTVSLACTTCSSLPSAPCIPTKIQLHLHLFYIEFRWDGVKKLMLQMEEQKRTYEEKALEALQKAIDEKVQAEKQAESLEVGGNANEAATAESSPPWECVTAESSPPWECVTAESSPPWECVTAESNPPWECVTAESSVSLQREALKAALLESERWKSLSQQLKKSSEELMRSQEQTTDRLHQLQSELEVNRG
uniref:Uncharacterized protein n=1 Tax=Paramormyrops kingsleyae TaxID=1676925 RepID=A0A3B3T349_9TELE